MRSLLARRRPLRCPALALRLPWPVPARLMVCVLAVFGMAACSDAFGPDGESQQPTRYASVAAGGLHTCALGTDDRTYCWGARNVRQLGGAAGDLCVDDLCTRPLRLPDTPPYSELTAGVDHTCGLEGGQVSCWGFNRWGQLGDDGVIVTPCPFQRFARCSASPHAVAIGHAMAAVSTANLHTCALTTDGTAFCWGRNDLGKLGTGDVEDRGAPVPVATSSRFQAISAGYNHTCGVTLAGGAMCWGGGGSGQLGAEGASQTRVPVPVAGAADLVDVAASGTHTCALDEAGAVSCWGLGAGGRLGSGDTQSSAAPVPALVPEPATALTAGVAHTCALGTSGTVYCWGVNANGQLGDETVNDRSTPTSVPISDPVRQISAGVAYTCAVTVPGDLYCWGNNKQGQLGDGTRVGRARPVLIGGPGYRAASDRPG